MREFRRMSDLQLKPVVHVAASVIHGTGLFASRDIAEGEYIGSFAGPEVSTDGDHVLWVYIAEDDHTTVARCGTNLLRYLNHASPCNASFDGFDLYAVHFIPRNDEITIHYGVEP